MVDNLDLILTGIGIVLGLLIAFRILKYKRNKLPSYVYRRYGGIPND